MFQSLFNVIRHKQITSRFIIVPCQCTPECLTFLAKRSCVMFVQSVKEVQSILFANIACKEIIDDKRDKNWACFLSEVISSVFW